MSLHVLKKRLSDDEWEDMLFSGASVRVEGPWLCGPEDNELEDRYVGEIFVQLEDTYAHEDSM